MHRPLRPSHAHRKRPQPPSRRRRRLGPAPDDRPAFYRTSIAQKYPIITTTPSALFLLALRGFPQRRLARFRLARWRPRTQHRRAPLHLPTLRLLRLPPAPVPAPILELKV